MSSREKSDSQLHGRSRKTATAGIRLFICGGLFLLVANGDAFAQRFDNDPTSVAKLLQFEPETPERLIEAALMADQIDRPIVARGYLAKLLGQNPQPALLVSLRTTFGPAAFLKLNANPVLQPEARQLLMAVNEAAKKAAPSDARLAELVTQLGTDEASTATTIIEILSAEERSVLPLLSADPATASGKVADHTLRRFARRLRAGLVSALPAVDDATRVRALNLLATTADAELVPDLLRWQFGTGSSADVAAAAANAIQSLSEMSARRIPNSPDMAIARLKSEIRSSLSMAGRRFPPQDVPGLSARPISDQSRDAANDRAAQLSRDAQILAPDDIEVAGLASASRWGRTTGGIDFVPDRQGESRGVLISALRESLYARNAVSAVNTLKLLSVSSSSDATGDSDHLQNSNAVLRRALLSADPRVRVLAARLAKTADWLDHNGVAVAQTEQAVKNGQFLPEAVVIDANSARMIELAIALEDAGFVPRRERTGAKGFDSAVGQLNCELILINSNCIHWDLSVTIANLRADVRTQLTPIVIYGPKRAEPMCQQLAASYPGVWFLDEPLGQMTLIERLQSAGLPAPLLSEADRTSLKAMLAPAVQ